MDVDSRSGADIAFDAGPDCLFGRSVVHFDDRTFDSLGEPALALAAAFSGMVNAKYAPSFRHLLIDEGIQCRLLLIDSLRA